jgi:hypothetical protein
LKATSALSRPQFSKVDLKKGSFSAKQITGGREVSMNETVFITNCPRALNPHKRSVSPNFKNSKFYQLSRGFKLTKAVLGCTSIYQKRTLSDSFKPEDFKSLATTPEPSKQLPCDQFIKDLDELAKTIIYRRTRA